MNYCLWVTRLRNQPDQIANTLTNWRHCLGTTRFAAAIDGVAKGKWVIIPESNKMHTR